MIRSIIKYVFQISALLGIVFFIRQNPGYVVVNWMGHEATIDIALYIMGMTIFLLLVLIVIRFWQWLWWFPSSLKEKRAQKRFKKSEFLCLESLTAFSAGEIENSLSLASEAQKMNEENDFSLIVSAQSAYAKGDIPLAVSLFTTLVRKEKTSFLGLRGLILLAQKKGFSQETFALLQRAHALRPSSPWVIKNLLNWDIKNNAFYKADRLVEQLTVAGHLTASDSAQTKGLIYWLKAKKSLEEEKFDNYYESVLKALKNRPNLAEASFSLAKYYYESDRAQKALKILTAGYGQQPLLKYGDVIRRIFKESALDLYKHLIKITDSQPHHPVTALLRADFAIMAQLWGEGRANLAQIPFLQENSHLYTDLVKDMERGLNNQDPTVCDLLSPYLKDLWVCNDCHHEVHDWGFICPSCDSIDSFRLKTSLSTPVKKDHLLFFG